MSLLEQAIAATVSAKSNIVSVNNDASTINWVAGLSDPGEMIGCGMYQQLRRLANESDEVYQHRLTVELATIPAHHRAEIERRFVASANRRASLDRSNGKIAVMVAGKAPWHGLGVNVREAVNSSEAQRLSGTDFELGLYPLHYRNPITGEMADTADKYAVVRKDTGAYLGTVGSRYQLIQNSDGYKFLDGVLSDFGARYESAGSLYGGKKVWMLVHLPKQAFAVNGSDRVEPYVIFTNCNDGTGAAYCHPTTERVVCANTFRIAHNEKSKGISMRHTGDIGGRIGDAKRALGIAVQDISAFKTDCEAMTHTKMDPLPLFDGILDHLCEIKAAQIQGGVDGVVREMMAKTALDKATAEAKADREIRARKKLFDEVMSVYESDATNSVNGMRGTAWSGFNAITQAVDHGNLGGRNVGDDKGSARFESTINGKKDAVKQLAYDMVMQTVSAN